LRRSRAVARVRCDVHATALVGPFDVEHRRQRVPVLRVPGVVEEVVGLGRAAAQIRAAEVVCTEVDAGTLGAGIVRGELRIDVGQALGRLRVRELRPGRVNARPAHLVLVAGDVDAGNRVPGRGRGYRERPASTAAGVRRTSPAGHPRAGRPGGHGTGDGRAAGDD